MVLSRGSGSLEAYLAAFEHTLAVLQRPEALRRAAYEAVIDLHAHNVVYAEIRFAPSLNTGAGGRREDAVEAVLDGLGVMTGDVVPGWMVCLVEPSERGCGC